jgi:hypothetical protein
MCKSCWIEHGSPKINNEKVIKCQKIIKRIYEDHCTGGNLHVIVDDFNIDDSSIEYFNKEDLTETEREFIDLFKDMTIDERASALALYSGYFKYEDEYIRWIREIIEKVINPADSNPKYEINIWIETADGELIDPIESANIYSIYVVQLREKVKYSLFNIRFRLRGEYVLECCGNTNDEDVINDFREMLGKPLRENARTMKLKENAK